MTANFCKECGALLQSGKICKKCTPYLSKKNKKAKDHILDEEKRIPQRFFTKKVHTPNNNENNIREKKTLRNQLSRNRKRKPKTVAIYSEERGLEVGWDLDTPEKSRHRAVFCIKCKKPRANWEGIWVVPGGKGRSLDSEIKLKRVFLCSRCWSPYKNRKNVSVQEMGLDEDSLFNPL